MANSETNIATIVANLETFKTQARKCGGSGLSEWVMANEEALMLAPASTRLDHVCAYPGGLVEHSLRVLSYMAKLRVAYGCVNSLSVESVLLVGLFHDIGKVGTDNKSYYVDNQSSWHREKLGIMYTIHEKLQHLSVSQLSLMRLVDTGVHLSSDEWYAINSLSHKSTPNKGADDIPVSGEPMLAVILQQAVKVSCMEGKGKTDPTKIG